MFGTNLIVLFLLLVTCIFLVLICFLVDFYNALICMEIFEFLWSFGMTVAIWRLLPDKLGVFFVGSLKDCFASSFLI
ncbi:hypothetical protein SAMN05216189_103035 [Pseudomonas delhiensis]|uniref:Uncharacterized protein n=1 Tax=Pseudomonas delhiensis TaxID=366289 RepID=A0A239IAQ3_9PSED|nr:hypothetical protein SAMN05216189_103035 [Pseudomonas delhiensis]SNS90665.1 hypothetical protein SAMN06295949_109145 [Pseudomonas delhiensis]